jgi:hypothetical protein
VEDLEERKDFPCLAQNRRRVELHRQNVQLRVTVSMKSARKPQNIVACSFASGRIGEILADELALRPSIFLTNFSFFSRNRTTGSESPVAR